MEFDNAPVSAADPTVSAPANTPDPATSDPSAAPAATPQAPAAAPVTQPSGGMVPSYRIRETRDAAIREAQQQFAAKEQEYQQRLQQIQSQLHALVGVTPPADPQVELVRNQFNKLFPGLAKLEERANDLMGLADRSTDFDVQSQHYWQSYGRQQTERLYSLAEQSLGTQLSDDARRVLHTNFVGYVSSSPEAMQRYSSDPNFVAEYWQSFAANFIDPVRRVATAGVEASTAPRALPRDTASGVPAPAPAPAPSSLDERVAGAWASYNAARKP